MKVRELSIPGCFQFIPGQHRDDRGTFLEWFRADEFAQAVGHRLTVAQANHSVSGLGVLRGLHYALVPPGQAKYVYCPYGAVLDLAVDIRSGSPSFGNYDAVRLDDVDRAAVYLPEGIGHAFVSLAESSMLTYLCSTGYEPDREQAIDPLDPELGLPWPDDLELVLSARDRAAPGLAAAGAEGLLPSYDDCERRYRSLRGDRSGGQ